MTAGTVSKPSYPNVDETPAMAALIDVWEAYKMSEASDKDVIGVVHQVGLSLEQHLVGLEKEVARGRSSLQDDTVTLIGGAFVRFQKAIKLMLEQFTPGTSWTHRNPFESGLELARSATRKLLIAHQRFLEEAERDAWLTCPACSSRNRAENSYCNSCLQPLPVPVEICEDGVWVEYVAEELKKVQQGDFRDTPNFKRLDSAINSWAEGELMLSELDSLIQRILAETERHLQANTELRQELQSGGEPRGELSKALKAVEEHLETALRALRRLAMGVRETPVRKAVVRVRLVDYQLASQALASSYFTLKRAYES